MNQTRKEIVADTNLIAYCGLYCGACPSYLKGKCPGCHENAKASWCTVRSCNMEQQLASCADCTQISHRTCKKYNNFMSKMVGFILRSDRAACIDNISSMGYAAFAEDMVANKRQTIRRK